jgi:glycosyltransferase involved in cell wall biosynthesis
MRVLFFTRPATLDPALQYAQEMSRLTEFHLVLEVEPTAWSAVFASAPIPPAGGVVAADPILSQCLPPGMRVYWRDTASFTLVAYANRRSIHPASIPVSHAAIRLFRELRPDVLHFDDVSLRLSLNFPEVPRIDFLSVHDPEVHGGEEDWRRHLARRLTFGKVNRFILHNAAQVGAFCERYRIPQHRVDVSHLGAYTMFREWAHDAISREPRTVLFFGRLSKYKGLEGLYQAMPLVSERVPGVRLVVAGRPEFGYVPPRPPELSQGGKIEILDRYIPNSELAELMQRASVVACPYTTATQSGVVLTAYGFGTPVVATAVGGLPEYVRDGESGIVVPPNDSAALADALTRVLTDDGLRRSLTAGIARLMASELSWATRASRMLELYRTARRHTP